MGLDVCMSLFGAGVKSDLSFFPRAKIYNKKRYAEKIQMKKRYTCSIH